VTASSAIVVGGNSTAAGYVDLLEDSDNGSNRIRVTAPSSVASDKTITLPDTTGTVALTANKLDAFAATTSAELEQLSQMRQELLVQCSPNHRLYYSLLQIILLTGIHQLLNCSRYYHTNGYI